MIKIGNDVQITAGITILSHGFDWVVLKGVYGEVLGSSGGGWKLETMSSSECIVQF